MYLPETKKVKSSANFSLFYPEEKWVALNGEQQFARSVLTHAGVLAILFAIMTIHGGSRPVLDSHAMHVDLVLSDRNSPPQTVQSATSATDIETEGASASSLTDSVARTPLEVTPNSRPAGDIVKPPEITLASTRPGPAIKQSYQAGEHVLLLKQPQTVPVPVNTMATSPNPSEKSFGPVKEPSSGTIANGDGARHIGAPQPHPGQISQTPSATVSAPASTETIEQSVGSSEKNGVVAMASPGQSTTPSIPVAPETEKFADLDSKACLAFYRGEQIAAENPDEAKKLYESAAQLMARAIPVLEREQSGQCDEMALALSNTGRCFDHLDQNEAAASYFDRASKLYEKLGKQLGIERGAALVYLADSLTKQGKFAEAEKPLKDSLPSYCTYYGKESQYVAWTYKRLATVCKRLGREDEANNYTKMANAMLNH